MKGRNCGSVNRKIARGEEGIGMQRGGRKRRRGFCGASKFLRQSVVQEDLCLNSKLSPCYPD
jgi:hypothetical protein